MIFLNGEMQNRKKLFDKKSHLFRVNPLSWRYIGLKTGKTFQVGYYSNN